MVESTRYIVELKAVPLAREHIGQIVEYYGLMKEYLNDANLRMMLVSPSIPSWKSVLLEEMGIQCIEFDLSKPVDKPQLNERQIVKERKKVDSIITYIQELAGDSKYEKSTVIEFVSPTRHDVSLVRATMQEILPAVANNFEEFEPYPFGIPRAGSTNEFFYEYIPGKYETDLYIPDLEHHHRHHGADVHRLDLLHERHPALRSPGPARLLDHHGPGRDLRGLLLHLLEIQEVVGRARAGAFQRKRIE